MLPATSGCLGSNSAAAAGPDDSPLSGLKQTALRSQSARPHRGSLRHAGPMELEHRCMVRDCHDRSSVAAVLDECRDRGCPVVVVAELCLDATAGCTVTLSQLSGN